MTLKITYINEISPEALEFDNGVDEDTLIHPEAAFEIIGSLNNERLETYGIIWIIEGLPHAFIAEELEVILLKEHANQFTADKQKQLNEVIMRKYQKEKLELPATIF